MRSTLRAVPANSTSPFSHRKKPPTITLSREPSLMPIDMDTSVADIQRLREQLAMPGTDRIRAILGVRQGASLPAIGAETLRKYYQFLLSQMTLPCEASYSPNTANTIYPVTVVGLIDPATAPPGDRDELYCSVYYRNELDVLPLVDIEVAEDSPNFRLLEDYWFWSWNWRNSGSYRQFKSRWLR